ncbi:MAG: hypothetical protein PHE20_02380 [Patescibacteria group bacterium]|nr:hypothetical protein [Patescibacteria group bacterium]
MQTKRQNKKIFSWRPINTLLGIACLAFGFVYLIGMNDLTVKGFVLNDLKSQASILAEENQDLQTRSLTLQSYTALSPRLQNLNMVQVEDVAYFSPQASVVAKK